MAKFIIDGQEIPIGGSSSEWTYLDTFDLSSGALSYEIDTGDYKEVLILNTGTGVYENLGISWRNSVTSNSYFSSRVYLKASESGTHLTFLPNNIVRIISSRSNSDTLTWNKVVEVDGLSTKLSITFTSVTSGIIIYGK